MVTSGHFDLRERIAGETMQAIPAMVELACSRLGVPLANRRDRGAGLLAYPDPAGPLLQVKGSRSTPSDQARRPIRAWGSRGRRFM